MRRNIVVITGTDTGIGKTIVTATLAALLRAEGEKVAALKPVCSGGRSDARVLRAAAGNVLPLETINPWHFRAALAPVLAARKEKRRLGLAAVVRQIEAVAKEFNTVLVEGAGGLLSPLGEGFDTRNLLRALGARPVVVAPNRLGAVNQVRLVLEALPGRRGQLAEVVLVQQPGPRAAATNEGLLAEFFPARQIHKMPWLGRDMDICGSSAARALGGLAARLGTGQKARKGAGNA